MLSLPLFSMFNLVAMHDSKFCEFAWTLAQCRLATMINGCGQDDVPVLFTASRIPTIAADPIRDRTQLSQSRGHGGGGAGAAS